MDYKLIENSAQQASADTAAEGNLIPASSLRNTYEVTLLPIELADRVEEIYAFLAMQLGLDYISNGPRDAMRRRYPDDIDERIASCLANQCADEIIAAESLPAALEPELGDLSSFEEGKKFTFQVTIPLKPTLELSSYDPVEMPLPNLDISEDLIQENIQLIIEDRAKFVEDKSAKCADENTFNVIGLETNKSGMRVSALCSSQMVYQIGEGRFPEEIDKQLMGMKPGESKTFTYDVKSKNFLGLDVTETFETRLVLEGIVVRQMPEVTDEWVRENVAGAHDMQSFHDRVEETLIAQTQEDYDKIKGEIVASRLAERLPEFTLDQVYYDYVRGGLLQNVSTALSMQGMSEQEFFESQPGGASMFMLQMDRRAREVLRHGIALDAYARHFELELSEDDIQRALTSISHGREAETQRMLKMNGRLYQLHEMALRTKARALAEENAIKVEPE